MYEVAGIGMDLREIERMRPMCEREHFLARVLTEGEKAYIQGKGGMAAQSLAAIWAGKEAVLKALGTGLSLSMKDVEICHRPGGQPCVSLHGEAKAASGGGRMHLSLTHEGGMAGAFCVWERPVTDPPAQKGLPPQV